MFRCLQNRCAAKAYAALVVLLTAVLLGNPVDVLASDWVKEFDYSQTSLNEIVIPSLPEPGQFSADPHVREFCLR